MCQFIFDAEIEAAASYGSAKDMSFEFHVKLSMARIKASIIDMLKKFREMITKAFEKVGILPFIIFVHFSS